MSLSIGSLAVSVKEKIQEKRGKRRKYLCSCVQEKRERG
jgi:hypothetical protein